MEVFDTCVICGMERECAFHAFCRCPMARSLWQAMEKVWPLPDIGTLTNTSSEWLLHLLEGRSETVRAMIIMTLWRIWHCRNEVIHHKPAPPIEASRRFLCSYLESLFTIKQFPNADVAKGKTVVSWSRDNKLKTTPGVSKTAAAIEETTRGACEDECGWVFLSN